MIALRKVLTGCTLALCLAARAAPPSPPHVAAGTIAATNWPYLPGSVLALRVDGFSIPYHTALVGPGRLLEGGFYEVPGVASLSTAMLIAGNADGLAVKNVRLGPPPSPSRPLLAIASYDDGIVFHDARTFLVLGVLATRGAPSDVAIDARGQIAATDTQGSALTIATLAPWSVDRVEGVMLADELAIDEPAHAIFVTNRDVGGRGALTRVDAAGRVTRVVTGETAEGLAIDPSRQIVYVANVNDGTVAAVSARSMRVLQRFPAVARVFSLALSPDGSRLFCISNQSSGSVFGAPGSAVAIALHHGRPHVIARSAPLGFPIGAALDPATGTLFVTDEALDEVYVLDARTLRAKHPPISTCSTPWTPTFDPVDQRLYVPCARANAVEVFGSRSLSRLAGTPFATGSYPLAVTVWHPGRNANRSNT